MSSPCCLRVFGEHSFFFSRSRVRPLEVDNYIEYFDGVVFWFPFIATDYNVCVVLSSELVYFTLSPHQYHNSLP